MMSRPRDGNHFFKAGQHDVVEEAAYLFRWLADTNWRADLRAVAAVTGGKFHNDDIAVTEHATRRTRIAEDQCRIFHRRRTDDREVDITAAFENRARRCGFELVFGYAGPATVCKRSQRVLTELARLTDALELFVTFLVDQLMH